jgi:hypothetical protein
LFCCVVGQSCQGILNYFELFYFIFCFVFSSLFFARFQLFSFHFHFFYLLILLPLRSTSSFRLFFSSFLSAPCFLASRLFHSPHLISSSPPHPLLTTPHLSFFSLFIICPLGIPRRSPFATLRTNGKHHHNRNRHGNRRHNTPKR